MDETERRIRRRLKDDFEHYAKKCLRIRTESNGLQPFVINKSQRYLHEKVEQQKRETGKVRAIIVKGRQQGCSTYIEGRFFWLVTHNPGMRAFILTHDIGATNNLFEMAQRFYEYCPLPVRPSIEASNSKELIFAGIDSGYKLGTAGNKAVGRSSTIQLFHGSETGYWPHAIEHAKGILQAIPSVPGTEVFLESTANGAGNYFHEQWQMAEAGKSDFIPIFIPWFWKDEYQREAPKDFDLMSDESDLMRYFNIGLPYIVWRRHKIIELSTGGQDGLKSFMQEYPCTAAEAFQRSGEDSLIHPDIIMEARKASDVEPYGNLVIGVDPARFGSDRTSIIRRKGRVAYGLESHNKKSTMEVANMVHRIISEENPARVFIDIGGLGAGVYDRLAELGHKELIVGVNGGATPFDQKKYYNKRAEMWGEMNAWLNDLPCKIPDFDSLHSDLCTPLYSYDSNSRLVLEKKELMKKRGFRSPDEADALALTFALPETALIASNKKRYSEAGKEILGAFNNLDRLKKRAYIK